MITESLSCFLHAAAQTAQKILKVIQRQQQLTSRLRDVHSLLEQFQITILEINSSGTNLTFETPRASPIIQRISEGYELREDALKVVEVTTIVTK